MLQYHGKLDAMREELGRYGEGIEQAYLDALGKEFYGRVQDAAGRLITPDSFMDDSDEVRLSEGSRFAPGFGLLRAIGIRGPDSEGPISGDCRFNPHFDVKIHTAPQFIFPKSAFGRNPRPKLPDYASSYVHEFSHFIAYVLQKYPTQAVITVPQAILKQYGNGGRNMIEIMERAGENYRGFGEVYMALLGLSEAHALRMESMVWRRLGFKRQDAVTDMAAKFMLNSDVHDADVDDSGFLERMIDWDRKITSPIPPVANFIATLKPSVSVFRYPVKELQSMKLS